MPLAGPIESPGCRANRIKSKDCHQENVDVVVNHIGILFEVNTMGAGNAPCSKGVELDYQ